MMIKKIATSAPKIMMIRKIDYYPQIHFHRDDNPGWGWQ